MQYKAVWEWALLLRNLQDLAKSLHTMDLPKKSRMTLQSHRQQQHNPAPYLPLPTSDINSLVSASALTWHTLNALAMEAVCHVYSISVVH